MDNLRNFVPCAFIKIAIDKGKNCAKCVFIKDATTFSIKTLRITTLSIKGLICDTQHK